MIEALSYILSVLYRLESCSFLFKNKKVGDRYRSKLHFYFFNFTSKVPQLVKLN